jgi:AcrR family transcriptional regulator
MASRQSRVAKAHSSGGNRSNQRLRTRKDLLQAAARLMRKGDPLSLEAVAEEALTSRATVYRYFSSIEDLLIEAPLDDEVPLPEELFADLTSDDAEERVDLAEAALHEMVYANQTQLRMLLANSLTSRARAGRRPVRQNRRLSLIEAALAPQRAGLDDRTYARLCAALALVFGTESMVVLTDVLPTSPEEARRIKSWVVRTLVRAAREQSTRKRAATKHPASGRSRESRTKRK